MIVVGNRLIKMDRETALINIAMVASVPPPYRIPIYKRLSQTPGVNFRVFFCSEREPNRQWDLPPLDFDHIFLHERFITRSGRFIHNNPDVIPSLKRFGPDVIVTSGFNPTHLYAFGFALMKGLAHVPMTDGTYRSEQSLSVLHRVIRRFIYARSRAYISASLDGRKLYESYGVPASRCFRSCLCVDNAAFSVERYTLQKKFDFIFCGRIEPGKNPLFALKVALEVAKSIHRKVQILFVGAGSQEDEVMRAASQHSELVEAEFNGFAAQRELPALYGSARVFLFPTLADVWGVVANEACASGLPIIVSPYAGVVGELVLDGLNGFVCELDAKLWARRAVLLLTQPDVYQRFSDHSRLQVNNYTFDNAVSGLLSACRFALANGALIQIRDSRDTIN